MTDNEYLLELIAQGEHEQQDFKYKVDDAMKLARSVSAFANTEGGRLLIGVRDDGNLAGVRSEEEIYMVHKAAYEFCRPEAAINFKTYHVEGRNIVIATVPRAVERPVYAIDEEGKEVAYIRIKDENIVASPVFIEMWRQESREENMMPYTDTESRLMEMMRLNPHQPIEVISKIAHIKRFLIIKILARLIRYDLASWEFNGEDFLFSLK
ncbi:helix-turn-helix domain-containing protein [Prevotella sp. KH2C16]|uniref:AlbA family DNA-binding domain-containing protein n=1 Tax=Prevotella sp. KH2C16 TaxID=1855325 RepID=UPI0008F27278|nr:ATP-binding protein [Prevotella sp. KH2C16]SFG65489.1 Putative DNA-binding domain-containing protein [Prevotella sp. KH2C16]